MAKKILVVDDNRDILDAMELMLQSEGYTVLTTTHGEDTQALVRTFTPQLIILDLLLSGVDGGDICRELQKNPETNYVPVIMVSAHPSAKRTAMQSGAREFIAKPFDVEELLLAVKKYSN